MWAYNNKFSFLVFNLDEVLKNSTGEEISYIWQIEWVQIDATKFERMQIYFLATFPLLSSLSLLKLLNGEWTYM